jgi:hypothetical protein
VNSSGVVEDPQTTSGHPLVDASRLEQRSWLEVRAAPGRTEAVRDKASQNRLRGRSDA